MNEVGFEEGAEFFVGSGEEVTFAGFFEVGPKVNDADGMAPKASPVFEVAGVFGLDEAVIELSEEGGMGGILEGAEHARDIAERGAFDAAFAKGAGGFAFEINDEKILAGVEDLAEVEVAMDANARAGDAGVGEGAEPLDDGLLEGEDLFGFRAHGFGE